MRQGRLGSLSEDQKQESWSRDREMEGLWTRIKITVMPADPGSQCN